jgi:3-keto-disaccharide hydrolase
MCPMEKEHMMKTILKVSLLIASLFGVVVYADQQQPAGGQQPNRPAQSYPAPASGAESGFEPIFDGNTLKGWEGDPKYWRVENGCLVGEVTPETILKQNSFIIWRGGVTRDFELKVEYRVSAQGNSGINYRSVELPGQPWAMKGYQADIEGQDRWTGQVYEERGRTFLALRGQVTHATEGGKREIIASLGDAKELQAWVKKEDWNQCHLIIRGNVLIHILNGHVMSGVIDDDVKERRFDGLLGVQVHVGPPMKIEYRNFRLKKL